MPDADIQRVLGELVAGQRAALVEQKRVNDLLEKHFEDDKREFGKVNTRIRGVEQRVNYAAGGVAVVVMLATIFWDTVITSLRG